MNLCGLNGQVHADYFGLILALLVGDLALTRLAWAQTSGF